MVMQWSRPPWSLFVSTIWTHNRLFKTIHFSYFPQVISTDTWVPPLQFSSQRQSHDTRHYFHCRYLSFLPICTAHVYKLECRNEKVRRFGCETIDHEAPAARVANGEFYRRSERIARSVMNMRCNITVCLLLVAHIMEDQGLRASRMGVRVG